MLFVIVCFCLFLFVFVCFPSIYVFSFSFLTFLLLFFFLFFLYIRVYKHTDCILLYSESELTDLVSEFYLRDKAPDERQRCIGAAERVRNFANSRRALTHTLSLCPSLCPLSLSLSLSHSLSISLSRSLSLSLSLSVACLTDLGDKPTSDKKKVFDYMGMSVANKSSVNLDDFIAGKISVYEYTLQYTIVFNCFFLFRRYAFIR